VLEGARFLRAAVAAGAHVEQLVGVDEAIRREADLVASARSVVVVTQRELAAISATTTPQGLVGVLRRVTVPVEALEDRLVVLALDGVQDPGNVGTLVRTAAALSDAVGVLVGPGSADPFNPKAARAAAGALERVPIAEVDELTPALRELRVRGARVIGLDPRAPSPLAPETQRRVLVVGAEGAGLSAAVDGELDERAALVVPPRLESLNAAVAGALALWVSLGGGAGASTRG